MKIISYIITGISLFFGVLFIWGAFSTPFDSGSLIIGLIMVAIGIIILYVISKNMKKTVNTYKVDLPGEVKVSNKSCQQCGGPLNANDFKIVNGTPTVECHYCGAVYEVTEEPKW
jgi:ribosomal protein S27AE